MRTNDITRGNGTSLALALAVALGMTVHGQAPVNRGSQGVYPPATQGQVTWIGCLRPVEQNPSRPGTGDNREKGRNEASKFVLKDASPANDVNTRSTREIGLRTSKVDLAQHMNRQVELTGRLIDAREATNPSSALGKGASAGGAAPSLPNDGAIPQNTVLEVTSAKTTSPACAAR